MFYKKPFLNRSSLLYPTILLLPHIAILFSIYRFGNNVGGGYPLSFLGISLYGLSILVAFAAIIWKHFKAVQSRTYTLLNFALPVITGWLLISVYYYFGGEYSVRGWDSDLQFIADTALILFIALVSVIYRSNHFLCAGAILQLAYQLLFEFNNFKTHDVYYPGDGVYWLPTLMVGSFTFLYVRMLNVTKPTESLPDYKSMIIFSSSIGVLFTLWSYGGYWLPTVVVGAFAFLYVKMLNVTKPTESLPDYRLMILLSSFIGGLFTFWTLNMFPSNGQVFGTYDFPRLVVVPENAWGWSFSLAYGLVYLSVVAPILFPILSWAWVKTQHDLK